MAKPIHSPRHVGKDLQDLVAFAQAEGWTVTRTGSGHLRFTKPGRTPIFTSSTASDFRSDRNARSRLRRADRQAHPSPREVAR